MKQELDCRGQSCPQPVINTKKALEKIAEGTVTTIVDNDVARENLLKFALGMNYSADVEQQQNDYYVTINKERSTIADISKNLNHGDGSLALLVTANVLGRGNDELGAVLIKSFFYALTEQENLPSTIAFLNSGVYLTCENSSVLEHMLFLEEKGVEILSCGTCLDFYNLKDKLCAGSVSNMFTILEKISKAGKAITI